MAPELSMTRFGVRETHDGSDEDENEEDNDDNLGKLLRSKNIVCHDSWEWSYWDCSPEVNLHGDGKNDTAFFHPHWSNGTAGVRSDRPLAHGAIHFWEIHIGERVFGTSLMFGVSTKSARLHASEFKCLLGEDGHGWGLSHRGRVHHGGLSRYYCKPFAEYTPVVVGVLLDTITGEMAFYKDGICLDVAFTGLHKVEEPLYPTCTSTAAKTIMRLGKRMRTFIDLEDRCRQTVCSRLYHLWPNRDDLLKALEELPVPRRIKEYLIVGL